MSFNLTNFSINFYFPDIIKTKFPSKKKTDITSKLSRWLSSAGDREGHRKDRGKKNQESKDYENRTKDIVSFYYIKFCKFFITSLKKVYICFKLN